MTQQNINVGSASNDGTGDPLRTAMQKVQANFTDLYTYSVNTSQLTSNLALYTNTVQLTANLANYTNTASLPAVINTLASNTTSYVGNTSVYITAANVVSNGQLQANLANYIQSRNFVITGYISGTTLTVTGTPAGVIAVGQGIIGSGITSGTVITAGSGTSWTVSISQTVGSSSSPINITVVVALANYVNTTANFVPAGVFNFTGNVSFNGTRITIGSSTGLQAGGGTGTSGQILQSTGTSVAWVGTAGLIDTTAQYAWSNTQSFSNNITFGNTITVAKTATFSNTITVNTATFSNTASFAGNVTFNNSISSSNVWFETTANNRIQYAGSNTYVLVAGGANTLSINATSVTVVNSAALIANGSPGALGSVLTSNGTGLYWGTGGTGTGSTTAATVGQLAFYSATNALSGTSVNVNSTGNMLITGSGLEPTLGTYPFTKQLNITDSNHYGAIALGEDSAGANGIYIVKESDLSTVNGIPNSNQNMFHFAKGPRTNPQLLFSINQTRGWGFSSDGSYSSINYGSPGWILTSSGSSNTPYWQQLTAAAGTGTITSSSIGQMAIYTAGTNVTGAGFFRGDLSGGSTTGNFAIGGYDISHGYSATPFTKQLNISNTGTSASQSSTLGGYGGIGLGEDYAGSYGAYIIRENNSSPINPGIFHIAQGPTSHPQLMHAINPNRAWGFSSNGDYNTSTGATNIVYGNAGDVLISAGSGNTPYWGSGGSSGSGSVISSTVGQVAVYTTGTSVTGAGQIITDVASASFTGTISGTTLTISNLTGTLAVGHTIVTGATAGTVITAGSGTSWTVSISQTVGPVAMTTYSTGNMRIYGSGTGVTGNSTFTKQLTISNGGYGAIALGVDSTASNGAYIIKEGPSGANLFHVAGGSTSSVREYFAFNANGALGFSNTGAFSDYSISSGSIAFGTAGQVLTSSGTANTPSWQSISSIAVNVNATYVWTNTHSFSNAVTHTSTSNLVFNTGAKIIDSTGSQGTVGQVLTSNGVGNVYWSTISGSGTGTIASSTIGQFAVYTGSTTVTGASLITTTIPAGIVTIANNLIVGNTLTVNNTLNVSNSVYINAASTTGAWPYVKQLNISNNGSYGSIALGSDVSGAYGAYIVKEPTTGVFHIAKGPAATPLELFSFNDSRALGFSATGAFSDYSSGASAVAYGTAGQVLTSNGISNTPYWASLANQQFSFTNTHSYSNTITLNGAVVSTNTFSANGGVGTSGQVLTSGGSGANVYWSTVSGGGGSGTVSSGPVGGIAVFTGTVGACSTVVASASQIVTDVGSTGNMRIYGSGTGVTGNSTFTKQLTISNGGYGAIALGVDSTATYGVYLIKEAGSTGVFHLAMGSNTSPQEVLSFNNNRAMQFSTDGNFGNYSSGTAGQVLTSNGSSNAPYWSTPSVNAAAQYAWTNTQSFSNTVTHNGNVVFSTSVGIVQANGTTGTTGQVLTANSTGGIYWGPSSSYTLPTASTSTLGGVKVDGTTITISSGVISSAGGGSGTVTSSSSAANIAYYAATGTTVSGSAAKISTTSGNMYISGSSTTGAYPFVKQLTIENGSGYGAIALGSDSTGSYGAYLIKETGSGYLHFAKGAASSPFELMAFNDSGALGFSSTGAFGNYAFGSSGYVLSSGGSSTPPSWINPSTLSVSSATSAGYASYTTGGSSGSSYAVYCNTLYSSGDVYAYYSDQRLKTNVTTIQNPLGILNSIRGVTYQSNELAARYGFENKEQQIGVIAQEVQKVLPHVVKPAPFDLNEDGSSKSGENYLTVQYDKLVPLLIEAIKQLEQRVAELESK